VAVKRTLSVSKDRKPDKEKRKKKDPADRGLIDGRERKFFAGGF